MKRILVWHVNGIFLQHHMAKMHATGLEEQPKEQQLVRVTENYEQVNFNIGGRVYCF